MLSHTKETQEENFIQQISQGKIKSTDDASSLMETLAFTEQQQHSILLYSIRHGYLDVFTALIKKYPECATKTWFDHTTTLHLAVKSHSEKALDFVNTLLLQKDIKQKKDDQGIFPIQIAWQYHKKEMFEAMLMKILKCPYETTLFLNDIKLSDFDLWNYVDEKNNLVVLNNPQIVLVAVGSGYIEKLKWLIEEKGFSLAVKDEGGDDVVLNATHWDRLEILKWLVEEKKCSLEVTDNFGTQPVAVAAYNGHLNILKWLVEEKGCSLDVRNKDGYNPVLYATEKGHLETLKWLVDEKECSLNVKNNIESDPVLVSITSGKIEILKWLVEEKKCSLQVKTNDSYDPVLRAIFKNQFEILKWLVEEQGCSLQVTNKYGDDPVLIAVRNNRFDILKWLVEEKKCSLQVKNDRGTSPVLYAITNGCFEILKWLVEIKQCPLNVKDNNEDDEVLIASHHGKLQILKWLVNEKGCSLDVIDKDGDNPVTIAAYNNQYEIVKWLVEAKGCSLDVKENTGSDPVTLAVRYEDEKLLTWLICQKNRSFDLTNKKHEDELIKKFQSDEKISDKAFIQLFPYLVENAIALERISIIHSIMCIRYTESKPEWRKNINQCYEQMLERWFSSGKDINLILFLYCQADPLSALQFEINLYCKHANNENQYGERAINKCLLAIDSENIEIKKLGKISLAELLLIGYEIEEEGSPLNNPNLEYLGSKHNKENPTIFMRAIQAFYLLHDIEDDKFALQLKNQLHFILSCQSMQSSFGLTCSEATWNPEVRQYYLIYYLYKTCPVKVHVEALANSLHKKVENESLEMMKSLVSAHGLFGQAGVNKVEVGNQNNSGKKGVKCH